MKKVLLVALLGLFFSNAVLAQEGNKHFDFSAVCSTGQTLYYHIVKDKKTLNQYYVQNAGNVVEVTYPYFHKDYWDGYHGYTEPANNVVIPSQVTYKGISYTVVAIGIQAFKDCEGLKSVVIPNTVNIICGWAFGHCSFLESITLPNSLKEIGMGSFEECYALKSINIPNTVRKIGDYAFTEAGLTTIVFPNSLAIIPQGACQHCKKLQTVTLPTNLKEISYKAFTGCEELTTVTIPNTVTKIGKDAFHWCTSLQVIVPNTVIEVSPDGCGAFYYCLNVIYNGNLKGAPWGAKCLNGYVEGGCVYKDKTKTTLVACKPSNNNTKPTQNTVAETTSRVGNREAKRKIVNESNIMDYVESIKETSRDGGHVYYNVEFRHDVHSIVVDKGCIVKWSWGDWEFCTNQSATFKNWKAAKPNTKLGALASLYNELHKYE